MLPIVRSGPVRPDATAGWTTTTDGGRGSGGGTVIDGACQTLLVSGWRRPCQLDAESTPGG